MYNQFSVSREEEKTDNIKNLVYRIKMRPRMYIHEIRLEHIYYLIGGYLVCKITTNTADVIDNAFNNSFHHWVNKWLERNSYSNYSDSRVFIWYYKLQEITSSQEEAVELFYKLSDEFFESLEQN